MTPEIIRVSPWHMRRLFRQGRFLERLRNGNLVAHDGKTRHLSAAQALLQEQPYCTSSQMVEYLNGNLEREAMVHQYIFNGVIGGSGEPDPKRLEIAGIIYLPWPPAKTRFEATHYWLVGWVAGIRYKLFG